MSGSQSSSSLTCKRCGTVNTAKSKFCKKCGESLEILEICPKCGSKLESDADFCQQCGFKLKKEIEVPRSSETGAITVRRLPFGLEILIVFGLLGAAYYFFSSLLVIYGANTLFEGSGIYGQLVFTGILWAFIGAYLAIVSVGLWKLQKWARTALIIQAILVIVGAYFNPVAGALGLVYCVVILWYLYRPHIRSLFATGQLSQPVAPEAPVSTARLICPKCGRKGKRGTTFCAKCGTKLKDAGG
jgi:ribosomal protein L40E